MRTILKQLTVFLFLSVFFDASVYAENFTINTYSASSIKDLKHKAELGDAQAQYQFGRHYDPNYNEYMGIIYSSRFYYNQNALIEDFVDINPAQTDIEEAIKWYLKAAEQGNVEAQRNLGLTYLERSDSGRGYAKAAEWLLKAAKQGDTISQYYLGMILCWNCYDFTGFGEYAPDIKKNDREAAKWIEQAAKKRHPDAQYRYAAMLYEGRGVKKISMMR